jgi:hypothetical protein
MTLAAAETTILLAMAATLHAQTPPDPAETLSEVRLKISAAMRKLPKCTCVQTIDRSYFKRTPAASSCDQASADKKKGRSSLHLYLTDRIRLDVAQDYGHEIHSWPGAMQFDGGDIDVPINRGPVATGLFDGHLIDIFANDGTQFEFSGDKTVGGRRLFTYGYRVAEEMSHYKIRTETGWAITAYEGTFDIDPDSLELLRITVSTPELVGKSDLCEARSSVAYTSAHISDAGFLLPRVSQFHTIQRGVEETNSTSVFTNCREYQEPSASAAPRVKTGNALPLETVLFLRLNADLDSEAAAAGDPLTATLVHDVRDPKVPDNILIRAGAVAHGRISRMEHRLEGKPSFTIGFAWNSIEIAGVSWQLTAKIVSYSGEMASAPAPGQPADAIYVEKNTKQYLVKAGFEMKWVVIEAR